MVTLTGTFTRLDGTPDTGTVRITPSRSPIMDPASKIVISGPQTFPLDKDGNLVDQEGEPVKLPASNDPNLGPAFTYTVEAQVSHRPWKISKVWIPHGTGTVDLSTIADYTPTPGVATRVVTIPADGTDGQVLVWDGAGFSWADQQVAPPVTAAELIAERLTFRSGDITVGIASDSTSDGHADWVRLWEAHVAEKYPHLRIENNQWRSAENAYGPTVVVQEGDGEPAFSGEVLHDTFTRTTNLTTPDEGGPWAVTSPDAWVLTGTHLYATGFAQLRINPTGARDMTTTTRLDLDTTSTGNVQNFRIWHGGTNGAFIQIQVLANGKAAAQMYENRDNAPVIKETVDLTTALDIPADSPGPHPVTVTIEGSIQNFTATITHGSKTWQGTWTIDETTYAGMADAFTYYTTSASPGIRISEGTVAVADRPATYQTLRVWSGTMGGGTLQYQIDNWDAMFGDEEGTPGTPPGTEKRTLTDTFTRTGPVAGSSTDTGQQWTGHATWTTDGTKATATATGSTYVELDNLTRTAATVEVVTADPTSAKTLRLGLRTRGDGTNGLFLTASLTTTGAVTLTAYVRTPTGGFRAFPTMGDAGLTAGQTTPQLLPMEISLDGLTVTASAGTKTGTWVITPAEAGELGDMLEMQAASSGLSDRIRVISIEADYTHTTPGTPGVPATPLDVMIIGHGHNYGARSGVEFIPLLEGFLDYMRSKRPSTLPLLSSQNPQFPPTANPGPHADRQRALRQYAKQHGYSYAPIFEHFASQPDRGQSWIAPDGVHPTAPATPTPTPGTGMSEWGEILADTVTD